MPAARPPKLADRKLSAVSLRKLARAHTEAALQVLAEVATKGNSEVIADIGGDGAAGSRVWKIRFRNGWRCWGARTDFLSSD